MTELTSYLVGKIDQLYIKAFRLFLFLLIYCPVAAVFVLITFIIMAFSQDFFFPQGMFVWYRSDFSAVYFSLFGVSLFVSCACGIYAAEYFYTKALLWEVRMFFRDRVD